tara:strand:- start:31732 stop:32790 length:1059 start_codon:yes stop_codon:yes gene_type:complete
MRILALEKKLKKKICFLTKSGSTAIYLLIKSLEIRNKLILIPANICFDVVLVILFSGNKPQVLDVDHNQCLSYKSLKKYKNNKKIGAIIYPYMYGNYGEVFKIKNFAKKKNIHFIEDIAPSLGLKVSGKYAGSISDFSICSFGKGKIIDMNIGGSLNINSEYLYKKVKYHYSKLDFFSKKLKKKQNDLIDIYNGITSNRIKKKEFEIARLNRFKKCMISKYSFDRNYLRILNKKILQIKKINFHRNNKAKIFQKTIKNNNIKLIKHNEGGVYWRQNALLKKDRDKLQKYLFLKNIYARNYFPTLDQVFPFIYDKNIPLAKTFQRGVLNFWVGEQTSKKDIIETNMHINNFFK